MEEFSKTGRKLRPRKTAGAPVEHRTEKVEYGHGGEHRSFGGPRRSYGNSEGGEYRSFGEHKSFGGPRRNFGEGRPEGEHRSFGGPRRSYGEGGPRKSYGNNEGGERRNFDGPRKNFRGGKPGFKNNQPHFGHKSDEGVDRMITRRSTLDRNIARQSTPVTIEEKDEIRLNKFIANSGKCSRREADTMIAAGVVTVNGTVVTELGTKVNPLTDDVRFNGERLQGEDKVYIVMNKPRGFVTTTSDPHAEKTVMQLLRGCEQRVFPVGRLDRTTTGVLMFTNDGEISERLTHPSYDKKKIYQVILDQPLSDEQRDAILSGITLSDGPVNADELEYIDPEDHRKLGIEIHSGKNRIVRRIFESFGFEVRALDRVYFAGLTKKGLKKGEWRYLTESEIGILKMGAYI